MIGRIALAVFVLGAATLANADDYRIVELAPKIDPEEWAERNGIESFEKLPVAGGGVIARFQMEEGLWRPRSQALCTDTGVVSCGTDYCQTYFAPAASMIKQALMQRRAPDLSVLFPDSALPAPADPNAVPGAASCPNDSTTPVPNVSLKDDGSVALPDVTPDTLDRGCWEVVTAQACEMRARPMSDMAPEYEPKKLLAVIVTDPNQPNGLNPALLPAITAAANLTVLETTPLAAIGRVLVRLQINDPAIDTTVAVGILAAQPGVESAQHEYRYRTAASRNDPYAWMNYGARLTGVDRLHEATQGDGVTVAVIDSGVDSTHPELSARIAEQIDVTGFGTSPDRHGTAIAGLIAAEADNQLGAYGMAPHATLIAIKACQPESKTKADARCWSSTIAKALNVAIARGARIINMSLGGPPDPLVQKLVDAAVAESRLIIAAAGNGGPEGTPSFPASHPGVIAVTAVDARERPYASATRGDFIDLAAPGVEVPVPVPGETYPGQLSGTSMASAQASGVVALLVGKKTDATAEQIRTALESTAKAGKAPAATIVGHGRIDACAAARALSEDAALCADGAAVPATPATVPATATAAPPAPGAAP